ncbi:hypothetical protein BaRGS_00031605 [Batillaria attramentaria]|uniref:Uncharacterized protein n=1 Tax=Batillaria attramentaria TaxID=370345 RepID=A0ABD0JR08_9CAEN
MGAGGCELSPWTELLAVGLFRRRLHGAARRLVCTAARRALKRSPTVWVLVARDGHCVHLPSPRQTPQSEVIMSPSHLAIASRVFIFPKTWRRDPIWWKWLVIWLEGYLDEHRAGSPEAEKAREGRARCHAPTISKASSCRLCLKPAPAGRSQTGCFAKCGSKNGRGCIGR